MCDEGLKHSKLDAFLVYSNFIAQQPLSIVIVLPREHLDHTPLVPKPSNQDFGPPPFDSSIHGCTKNTLIRLSQKHGTPLEVLVLLICS